MGRLLSLLVLMCLVFVNASSRVSVNVNVNINEPMEQELELEESILPANESELKAQIDSPLDWFRRNSNTNTNKPTVPIQCRMLTASTTAYDVDVNGRLTAPKAPYLGTTQWIGQPTIINGGRHNINTILIGETVDGLVISFRGTILPSLSLSSVSPVVLDWLQDLNMDPTEIVGKMPAGAAVHKGFWNSVDSIWTNLVQAVRKSTSTRMYITGHSKGGAAAIIAAYRLAREENRYATGVYTFAGARAGNEAWVNSFPKNIPVIRYEFQGDLVPLLPPNFKGSADRWNHLPSLKQLFHNADFAPLGTLQFINRNGKVYSSDPNPRLTKTIEILFAVGGPIGIAKALTYHGPWCKSMVWRGGYMEGVCPGVCS
jgi:hypothetical protein